MKKMPFYSFLMLVLLLAIWEMAAGTMSELVLPAPSVIWFTLLDGMKSGYFNQHIIRTASEVLLGLLFGGTLGFVIGILMGDVTFLRKLLFPYIIDSQALVCFFPLLESTVTAIQSSDKQKQELFRMLGATSFQTLSHLKIPAGMPGILAGLRVSAVLAVVGAVVGEFIGGSEGLGALIIASQGMMDTPLMFATLILLTVMGMILYLMITWFEKKWLKRYQKEI